MEPEADLLAWTKREWPPFPYTPSEVVRDDGTRRFELDRPSPLRVNIVTLIMRILQLKRWLRQLDGAIELRVVSRELNNAMLDIPANSKVTWRE